MPSKPFRKHSPPVARPPSQPDLFDAPLRSLREDVEEFMQTWNSKIWLPKLLGTDRQAKMIREAMERPFFQRNWRGSFAMLIKSVWIRTKMRPAFRIDWYLIPDNFDKLMEGHYIDTEANEEPKQSRAKRTDDGEEYIS